MSDAVNQVVPGPQENSVYISGPTSGLPDYNYPAFNALAERLRGMGWTVVNPVEVCEAVQSDDWCDFMRPNIKALMDCEGIVMLPGYHNSKGAMLEKYIAEKLGMTVLYAAEMGWAA